MSKGYVGGENQNSEAAKKQIANFAEVAKGMGFALGIIATGEKTVDLSKKTIEGATFTKVNEANANYPGEQATKFDAADLTGRMAFGAATVVLAYNGRREMKKALFMVLRVCIKPLKTH